MSDTVPPAEAAAPSPYPTVQILQAAMAHRESIRSSFESQRAALTEAIAAQRQAVNQAVANTRQGSAGHSAPQRMEEEPLRPLTETKSVLQEGEWQQAEASDAMPAGEKLLTALTLLTAPGAAATKITVAQRAMIMQEFFAALKSVIAEEVAARTGPMSLPSDSRDSVGSDSEDKV